MSFLCKKNTDKLTSAISTYKKIADKLSAIYEPSQWIIVENGSLLSCAGNYFHPNYEVKWRGFKSYQPHMPHCEICKMCNEVLRELVDILINRIEDAMKTDVIIITTPRDAMLLLFSPHEKIIFDQLFYNEDVYGRYGINARITRKLDFL